MNKQNTEYLWNKYPLLYKDKTASIRHSLVPFGFEMDDGWFNVIDQASAKLEKEIQKYLDDNKDKLDCVCGHSKQHHTHYRGNYDGNCSYLYRMPLFSWHKGWRTYVHDKNKVKNFFLINWWRLKNKVQETSTKPFWWLAENTFIFRKQWCDCKEYYPNHPRASQVKEKLGGLKLYMSWETPEMEKIISEAEDLCDKTCETCGNPGQLHMRGYWLKTLCESCAKENAYVKYNDKNMP